MMTDLYVNRKSNFWMLPILLFLLYFGPEGKIGPVPVRSVDVFILLFSFIILTQKMSSGNRFFYSDNLRIFTIPVTIITLLACFSTAISITTGRFPFYVQNVFGLISFVRMMLIAVIAANVIFNLERVNWLVRMSFVVLLVAIGLTVVQKYKPYLVSEFISNFYFVEYERLADQGSGSRVVGTFGNPNIWGCGLLFISTIVTSAVFFSEEITHRFISLVIMILVMFCTMVLIASRTGVFLCLFILFMSFLLKLYCSRSLASAFFFGCVGVLLAALLVFIYGRIQVAGRVGQMLSGEVSPMSELSHRFYFWRDMADGIKSSPIWGIGVVKIRGTGSTADNGFLRVAYLSGLIGLAAYLCFYYKLFIKLLFSLKSAAEFRVIIVSSFLFLFVLFGYDMTAEPFTSVPLQGLIGINVGIACAALNAISELDEMYHCEYIESDSEELL